MKKVIIFIVEAIILGILFALILNFPPYPIPSIDDLQLEQIQKEEVLK